jgi:O-antigen ligase
VYVVLLCVIPSSLSFSALGSSVGRPATLWALIATLWWGWHHLQRYRPVRVPVQPVRIAMTVFLGIALASYAWAMLRGIPTTEISPADNGLLRIVSWAGILLIANDGITDPERFRTLLRRIALVGAIIATLGILQFITKQSLLDWVSIPGMSSDLSGLAGVDTRSGLIRASGTAAHPLEYGVLLSAAFPIAVTLVIEDESSSRWVRWYVVAAIGVAAMLSVSRSTLIGMVAGLLLLFPTWTNRMRTRFSIIGAMAAIALGLLVPGLAATLRALFIGGLTGDSSTQSRVGSYDGAVEFISRFPIIGKGFGTFLPNYRILDNQYLLLAIELGIAGIVSLFLLIGAAVWSAHAARRLAVNSLDRALCQSVFAAVIASALLLAFFDGFSFPIAAGMFFLIVGICGGARRAMMNSRALGTVSETSGARPKHAPGP